MKEEIRNCFRRVFHNNNSLRLGWKWKGHLQTERRLCPACIWRRCRSECCYCRRSRPEWPPSPARRSPSGRWSRRTRCRRSWERRLREVHLQTLKKTFVLSVKHLFSDLCGVLTRWCAAGSLRPCIRGRSCSGPVWTWPCRRPSGIRPASPRSPAQRRRGWWDPRSRRRSPGWQSHACSPSSAYRSSYWKTGFGVKRLFTPTLKNREHTHIGDTFDSVQHTHTHHHLWL